MEGKIEEARADEEGQRDALAKAVALLRDALELSDDDADDAAARIIVMAVQGHERRRDPGWAGVDMHGWCFRIFVDKYVSRYRRS